VLNFQDVLEKMNDDEFEKFCRHNPDMEIELTKEGEHRVEPPASQRSVNRVPEAGRFQRQVRFFAELRISDIKSSLLSANKFN
ncbi:MAG TPA: hypothetical protein VGP58_14825, partial [Pyrinomonadaceae bacterium]|nr:hypothetical protein [Pyrinomonadaceae bacterium]